MEKRGERRVVEEREKNVTAASKALICWLKRERGEGNGNGFVIYHFI